MKATSVIEKSEMAIEPPLELIAFESGDVKITLSKGSIPNPDIINGLGERLMRTTM